MADDTIWHVDENDSPIGPMSRKKSREEGLRYRLVRVLVETKDNLLLLQKRTAVKKTYPNCWDTSAGGNIDYPESYEEAAVRELSEEVGITVGVDQLKEVAYFYGEIIDPGGSRMNRFTKVYRVIVDKNTPIKIQESEVSSVKWVDIDELRTIVKNSQITDGLKNTFEQYYENH